MSTLARPSFSPLALVRIEPTSILTGRGWSRSSLASQTQRLKPGATALPSKRAVDIAGALVGLVLLIPVMLTIALLIRLEAAWPDGLVAGRRA